MCTASVVRKEKKTKKELCTAGDMIKEETIDENASFADASANISTDLKVLPSPDDWCSLINTWSDFLHYMGTKWWDNISLRKIQTVISQSTPGSMIVSAPDPIQAGAVCLISLKKTDSVFQFHILTWSYKYVSSWTTSRLIECTTLIQLTDRILRCVDNGRFLDTKDFDVKEMSVTSFGQELDKLKHILEETQMWWGSLLLDENYLYAKRKKVLKAYLRDQTVAKRTVAGLLAHYSLHDMPGYLFHVILASKPVIKVSFQGMHFQIKYRHQRKLVVSAKDLLKYIQDTNLVPLVPKDECTLRAFHEKLESFDSD